MIKQFGRYFILGICILFPLNSTIAQERSIAEFISYAPSPGDGSEEILYLPPHYLVIGTLWEGLRIYDIEDLENPKRIGESTTSGQIHGVYVVEPYVYVADGLDGLLIFDISDKAQPKKIGEISHGNETWSVLVKDGIAYVAGGNEGIKIINVQDPTNPSFIGEIPIREKTWAWGLGELNGKLFVVYKIGDEKGGVAIYDIATDPTAPSLIGQYDSDAIMRNLHVDDTYAYIANGPSGLLILDISDPTEPEFVSRFDTPDFASDVYVSGFFAYITDRSSGVQTINIANVRKPRFEFRYDTPGRATSISKYQTTLFLADGDDILILRHNNAPILFPIGGSQIVDENDELMFKIRGVEPDNDPFHFFGDNLPEGAVFDSLTRVFRWKPTYEQSGEYTITLGLIEATKTALTDVGNINGLHTT